MLNAAPVSDLGPPGADRYPAALDMISAYDINISMSRILIDLPEEDVRALDGMAQANGRSRAAEMREAVALYLRRKADGNWIAQGAGYWSARGSDEPGGAPPDGTGADDARKAG